MGKSSAASCFKIISCGTNSIDHDEFPASESKGSSDKHRWSFHKRSASHRLIVSEAPSAKDSAESANADLQTESNSTIPEKISVLQLADEKPRFSASGDSKLSEPFTTIVNDSKADITLDEQEVLVIQTAIRTFLAHRALLKHKNVTKLQAAVRGHLVRRHAVGTLRCAQAIVRMQAFVRARRANRLVQGSNISDKLDRKENLGTKSEVTYTVTYTSVSEPLNNSFAKKLLESTRRTKSINIKCDSSKSDSAWKWLERWMSVSSGHQQSLQSELPAEEQAMENIEWSRNLSGSKSKSIDFRRDVEASPVPSESAEDLITYGADSLDLQAHKSTSPLSDSNLEQSQPQVVRESNSRDDTLDSIPTHLKDSDELQGTEPTAFPCKTELEGYQNVHSVTKVSPKPPEPEDKRFLYGSRKANNPAFIAAQTKFKELSSTAKSSKVSSLSTNEVEVESCAVMFLHTTDHAFGAREIALSENSMRVQLGGSECGTELSISSTLDSPDRYEFGAHKFEQELKALENGTGDHRSSEHMGDDSITIPRNDLSYVSTEAGREDTTDDVHSEHIDVISPDVFHGEQKKESIVDALVEQADQTAGQVCKLSPEAFPRSRVTVPEFQGTPSSQVFMNLKKTRSEKSGSNPKHRSSSTGIRFPPKPKNNSSITSSERLKKEDRNGKQHSSFGSERIELIEYEHRDSGSSNSLPSYMQATKSARAKAMSNSSPNSSPDVQSREAYVKKKHSLSAGRQGSHRIRQSLSHAQQDAKGNGTQSPQERKWQR